MRTYRFDEVPFRGRGYPGWRTVDDARTLVRETLSGGDETHCPCCGQKVKLYGRALSLATGRVMVKVFRLDQGRDYVDLGPILNTMKGTPRQGGYGTLAHHWGLMEPMPGERPDGSKRVGWWKLNAAGRAFVKGEITVTKKAKLYDNHVFGFAGPQVTISDVLKTPFDFRDLMDGDDW